MNPLYWLVAARADYRCEYCRAPEKVSGTRFVVDHVNPRVAGGVSDATNLALACPACNGHKADRVVVLDPATGRPEPLFDPRRDKWFDHFRYDEDRGEVVGLTPVGRATVAALDMNSPQQLLARSFWCRFRLYP